MVRMSDLFGPHKPQEASMAAPVPAPEPVPGPSIAPDTTALDREAARLYDRGLEISASLFDQARRGQITQIDEARRWVEQFLTQLPRLRDATMRQFWRESPGNYLYAHSVNVTILLLIVAQGTNLPWRLDEIGLLGLLHDVGMAGAAESLAQQARALTKEEWETIRQHPKRNEHLVQSLSLSPEVKEALGQYHERAERQGYPEHKDVAEINEPARLLACCDAYESMTHARPFRPAMAPAEAVRHLLTQGAGLFDAQFLKTLVKELSLYPIGSRVRLNTGDAGEVCAVNREYPLRPVIFLTEDATGTAMTERHTLNLLEHPTLFIRESPGPRSPASS
ncbi:MAG: HD domain-containing protein [Candidatus Omnitrophica bacterium]|nr:HD domain-containing protein [Candidatus Omnitrophota bacterium]